MKITNIEYISASDVYTVKIVCDITTFIIPISKDIVLKHLYSFSMDSLKAEVGKSDIFIQSIDLSYYINLLNRRQLSVILREVNGTTHCLCEFDIKNSKLLPTISVSNTVGD